MLQNHADPFANSEDLEEQSDLGLQCLPRPICLKTVYHKQITYVHSQGLSLRAIWAKYLPYGPKFCPILVSGRSGSLPKKFFFFLSFHLVTIDKL